MRPKRKIRNLDLVGGITEKSGTLWAVVGAVAAAAVVVKASFFTHCRRSSKRHSCSKKKEMGKIGCEVNICSKLKQTIHKRPKICCNLLKHQQQSVL